MSDYSVGKFDSARDEVLYLMCANDWANESGGHVESPQGYFWRICNTWDEVQNDNGEINSLFEQILPEWIEDNGELRRSLVGNFLVRENSQGFVFVNKYVTEGVARREFALLVDGYAAWDDEEVTE